MTQSKSAKLFEQALKVLPGGVSRNTIFSRPHPTYVEKGEGCYVTDIEGNTRIDFANNMASLIHGHCQPQIIAAITEQLHKGTCFTLATEAEVKYAQLLCDRVPSFDKIRFTNSGTEAVMAMLKAARAYTGKAKIAKVEGAYHGAYDYAEASQTSSPANWGDAANPKSVPVAVGTPEGALDDVVIIPYNNVKGALEILNKYKGELACVLLDPVSHRVGLVAASDEFVEAIHQWTRENEALMVFDEVITFRCAYGGAQERYSVKPDMTAIGKLIGGGFPVGALAGSNEVMKVLDPMEPKVLLPHSGTFSANPITMTAGRVAMELYDETAVKQINALCDKARLLIEAVIETVGIKACVTGSGSMLRVHLKPQPPTNYREAYLDAKEQAKLVELLDYLFDNGLMMINTCTTMFSTAIGDKEVAILVETLESGFRMLLEKHPDMAV
ncbi:MAG: aspartate aminotransferase family protein [Algicola sp.]|nr:aspartate aminotransferase family protein [Algicola sp.]